MTARLVRPLVILLVGIGSLVLSEASAQEALARQPGFARNSIFLELGGNGIFYSLNYDHKFFDHVSARLGGMYLPLPASDDGTGGENRVGIALFPIMVNYLVGNGNSRLELGAGTMVGYVSGEVDNENLNAGGVGGLATTIGYRLQPRGGGFLFRVGLTPFLVGSGLQLWGGLSLGGTF